MPDTIIAFFENHPLIYTLSALFALLLAALVANFLIKGVLLRIVRHMLNKTVWGRDEEIRNHGFIERLANIMPALIISVGIMLIPNLPQAAVTVGQNLANAFIILMLAMAVGAGLHIVDTLYHRRPQARLKPIKSYLQIITIAVYAIAVVLMIATLVDRSPLILLSGLGAMAAVLILVFQDTLLSLVAGIQISSTDMVRVGDWVEMPALNADGDVIEIALHTVKVQNWDKTVTTIPIRKLVTDSFKNYRGMREAGGRRIKRAIYLDQTSIHFLQPDEISSLSRFSYLEAYLQRKQEELHIWNEQLGERSKFGANTRRITNIGTFRAYVEAYLRAHPRVHQHMTLLVRQLQSGSEGLPIEIYCFTSTTVWAEYEAIQSDIFDHLFAVMPEFGLAVFQKPSGMDMKGMFYQQGMHAERI